MNKQLLLILPILILSVGCITNNEDPGTTPPIMDVSISYVNEEGEDLLKKDYFPFYNIYYLQKNDETGEFEPVETAKNQHSFYVDEGTNRYALRVFPNREFIDGISITLIEDHRDNFDTLRVKGYNEGRGSIAERIWYNGKLVWETAPNPPRRYFTIIKPSL
ncbi:hypothetical protein [Fodinibius sp. SL11]|uniref:hypothetical protein n=1 Tax=Fodinibius sp. SL11 TaxID=3425690 RepID=UPI003F884139